MLKRFSTPRSSAVDAIICAAPAALPTLVGRPTAPISSRLSCHKTASSNSSLIAGALRIAARIAGSIYSSNSARVALPTFQRIQAGSVVNFPIALQPRLAASRENRIPSEHLSANTFFFRAQVRSVLHQGGTDSRSSLRFRLRALGGIQSAQNYLVR